MANILDPEWSGEEKDGSPSRLAARTSAPRNRGRFLDLSREQGPHRRSDSGTLAIEAS
jgi:hypothetical protein